MEEDGYIAQESNQLCDEILKSTGTGYFPMTSLLNEKACLH